MTEIEVVTLVRVLTGCGLKEACDKLVELGVFVNTKERGYILAKKFPLIKTMVVEVSPRTISA